MDRGSVSTGGRTAVAVTVIAVLALAIASAQQGTNGVDRAERNGWSPYSIGL